MIEMDDKQSNPFISKFHTNYDASNMLKFMFLLQMRIARRGWCMVLLDSVGVEVLYYLFGLPNSILW